MRFTIEHTTEYRFTRPVFLEPHYLRVQPRSDAAQRLLRFDLSINPEPAGTTTADDAEGNVSTLAWFNDIHKRLVVCARSEVETSRDNPYNYLLTDANRRLPVGYQPWEQTQLAAALRRVGVPMKHDPVQELAEKLREAASGEIAPFLGRLTATIYDRFKVIHREHGDSWPPATTMEQRQGACRDLAVLFVDACRAVGLAARFVSGYQEGATEQDNRHLHAWAEVFLPGAGWRGFDPTHGLAVADRHVALAAACVSQHAAPITATYRGNNVQAELHAEISIETSTAEPAAC